MKETVLFRNNKLGSYRLVVYITVATFSMVLFTYLTPPLMEQAFFSFGVAFEKLHGDYKLYLSRFIFSFLLLGIFPLLTALFFGDKPRSLGLIMRISPFRWYHILIFVGIAILAGISGGLSRPISGFYPYSQSLVTDVLNGGWYLFLIHIMLYGLLYYLPWEFFFRGFLILPFLHELDQIHADGNDKGSRLGLVFGIIVFQTIPSTLLHFGHPITELFSAIPAGIIFGWLVYKTKSIFPSFLLHFVVGIATDATIIIQHGIS